MPGQKFLFAALLCFAATPFPQQAKSHPASTNSSQSQSQSQKKASSSAGQTAQASPSAPLAIPPDAAKAPNPEKANAQSLANGKERYNVDCAMCHGANGNGKGFLASSMKLSMPDFRDPSSLKSATDGTLFWVISNGEGPMLNEKSRASKKDIWDLVNYVRSFARRKVLAKSR